MPVDDIDADGQIGLREGFAHRGQPRKRQPGGAEQDEVQVFTSSQRFIIFHDSS